MYAQIITCNVCPQITVLFSKISCPTTVLSALLEQGPKYIKPIILYINLTLRNSLKLREYILGEFWCYCRFAAFFGPKKGNRSINYLIQWPVVTKKNHKSMLCTYDSFCHPKDNKPCANIAKVYSSVLN